MVTGIIGEAKFNADEIVDFADTENCFAIFLWQKKFCRAQGYAEGGLKIE